MDKHVFMQQANYGELVCAIAAMASKAVMDYLLNEDAHKEFIKTLMMVKMARPKEGENDDLDE